MKKFWVVLLTLGLIMFGTYCQSADKKSEKESKVKMEQKGEKKSSLKAYDEEKTTTTIIMEEYEENEPQEEEEPYEEEKLEWE